MASDSAGDSHPVPAQPQVPGTPPPAEDEESSSAGRMSFLEHLDELRKRLVYAAYGILGGFVVAFAFIKFIFEFIMVPLQEVLPPGGRLVYTEPAEAFFLYMKMAALVGLLMAMPILVSQIWLFIAPGLYSHEKKFAIPFVALTSIFFLGGALFSHYAVFPLAWRFFAGFTTDYMEFLPRIAPVFALYVKMMLAMGIVFQLPTLVFFLAKLGLVTPGFLAKNTKYAILAIFIIAAVLTPSADPVTQTAMAAPMMVLYGISIGIAWVFQKKRPDDSDDDE
ncbi:MAG: twin-arginine translocase subunit TatC [Acidobacteria bacterium]|jgi:sec-independent protein translocase protein TatC|nr:twin-arginine translocase subunit TatC [Acidobacteriota bacterium]MDP7472589.1 twin-arginine translocase subunit TatC [Vicinamibacterales bacterium]